MMDTKSFGFEVKAAGDEGSFEGYASTFGGSPDLYGDIVTAGAFAKSLVKHQREGTWPMMFFGHMSHDQLPVGDWTDIAEDGRGLRVKGQLAMDDPLGARLAAALKSKRIRGLSIGYEVRKDHKDEKRPEVRHLDELDLWEVSIVNFPANRRALVTDAKRYSEFTKRFRDGEPPAITEFEEFLRDAGFPKSVACAIASKGYAAAIRSESEGKSSPVETLRAFTASLGG